MNPKIRIAIVAVALLGAVGLIIALTRDNGSGTPDMTSQPQSLTGATVPAALPSGPIATSMSTSMPRPTTLVITYATELPASYFDLTLAITASATQVNVGDVITITLTITNTGKLDVFQGYCTLYGWVEGGSPDVPFVEPNSQGQDADALNPGEQTTCTFTIEALQSADEVMLEGGYTGKVYLSPDYETDKGDHSPILKIKIKSENP